MGNPSLASRFYPRLQWGEYRTFGEECRGSSEKILCTVTNVSKRKKEVEKKYRWKLTFITFFFFSLIEPRNSNHQTSLIAITHSGYFTIFQQLVLLLSYPESKWRIRSRDRLNYLYTISNTAMKIYTPFFFFEHFLFISFLFIHCVRITEYLIFFT